MDRDMSRSWRTIDASGVPPFFLRISWRPWVAYTGLRDDRVPVCSEKVPAGGTCHVDAV